MVNSNPSKIRLFYVKIKHNLSVFKHFLITSEESKAFFGVLFEIIAFGLLTSLAAIPFGVGFSFLYLLGFGSAFWLAREKVLPMVIQMLNAFKLVMVYK